MYPRQPPPIANTDPNLTGAPMAMPMGPMPYLINSPQNFVYFMDPMTELSQSSGAIIRQQVEMLEVVTGCETQNRYHVFIETPMGLKYAFKCNERSGGCARCCCAPSNRELEMIIRHVISHEQLDGDLAKIFVRIEKPCTCPCCCFCRPHMDVRLEDTNKFIGQIREPCTCCDLDTEVYDSVGNLRYLITGDCCQLGLCCGSTAQKLASINFNILEGGRVVGSFKKLSSSFGEFFSKADSYRVGFPPNARPEDKMLLIIAGLMIDYQFFEKDEDTPTQSYYY